MNTFVDKLLPLDPSRTPDELRRARLLIIFSLALAANIGINLPILLAQHVWSVLTLLSIAVGVCAATPVVFRVTRSLPLAGNWMMFGMLVAHVIGGFYTGGFSSPGLVWWGTVVVAAVMLLGTRTGLVWMAIFIASACAIMAFDKLGIVARDDIPADGRGGAMVSSVVTSVIAFYFLARIYETLKQKMLLEIDASKRAVERAHAAARAVLNNVSQGLVIVEPDGRLGDQVSQALVDWFGAPPANATVFEYLGKANKRYADWLRLSWEDAFADVLPVEVVLGQMPARFEHGSRQLSVLYRPIMEGAQLTHVLLVITDITEQIATERAEEQQREMLASMQRIAADRSIFLDFLADMRARLEVLCQPDVDGLVELRELHTLKGNAGIYGLTSIARHCHEVESRLIENSRRLSDEERAALNALWDGFEQRVRPLLGESDGRIQLSFEEYNEALRAIADQESYEQLASRVRVWIDEPTEKRLSLFADQARAVAERLDKPALSVRVDHAGMRLPRERLREFWSTFVHVIRNAVDHGIESPEDRRAAGKLASGLLTLSTKVESSMVAIRVADDGRGIDWLRVSQKAAERGLPHHTREELEQALFSDGVSTKAEASEISGRGVGMSAVRDVVTQMGGSIQIQSTVGRGAEFTFLFPLDALRSPPRNSGAPSNDNAVGTDGSEAPGYRLHG